MGHWVLIVRLAVSVGATYISWLILRDIWRHRPPPK